MYRCVLFGECALRVCERWRRWLNVLIALCFSEEFAPRVCLRGRLYAHYRALPCSLIWLFASVILFLCPRPRFKRASVRNRSAW
jgi:hypothetical protein